MRSCLVLNCEFSEIKVVYFLPFKLLFSKLNMATGSQPQSQCIGGGLKHLYLDSPTTAHCELFFFNCSV